MGLLLLGWSLAYMCLAPSVGYVKVMTKKNREGLRRGKLVLVKFVVWLLETGT